MFIYTPQYNHIISLSSTVCPFVKSPWSSRKLNKAPKKRDVAAGRGCEDLPMGFTGDLVRLTLGWMGFNEVLLIFTNRMQLDSMGLNRIEQWTMGNWPMKNRTMRVHCSTMTETKQHIPFFCDLNDSTITIRNLGLVIWPWICQLKMDSWPQNGGHLMAILVGQWWLWDFRVPHWGSDSRWSAKATFQGKLSKF